MPLSTSVISTPVRVSYSSMARASVCRSSSLVVRMRMASSKPDWVSRLTSASMTLAVSSEMFWR